MNRSRWFVVPTVGLAIVLITQVAAYAAAASEPELPGLILFGRDTGSGGKFFTIRPDGTDERFLVDDIAGCLLCGEWSADGMRSMFAALTPDGRVTTGTIRSDGTDMVVLPIADATLHQAPGSWAPDGLHMAFDGWDDTQPGRRGTYLGAADGSETPRLISGDTGAEVVFGFARDGAHLLALHEGGHPAISYPHAGDLFLLAVDGSSIKQLNDPSTVVAMWDRAGDPASWSPDGRFITFAAFTDFNKGKSAVYVAHADGTGLRRIGPPTRSTVTARWSPDGALIAFHDGSPRDGDIVVIRPDGSGRRVLKDTNGCCPIWSPDSRALLFQRNSPAGTTLLLVRLADGSIQRLTDDAGFIAGVDW